MDREEYLKKRVELYNKAESLINSGKIQEGNKVIEEIKELDSKATAKVNEISFENNGEPFGFEKVKGLFQNTKMMEENSKGVFLNKDEKLVDRVNLSSEEKVLLNQNGALGNVVYGMVTGKWSNNELKNVIGTTSSGTLIPEILSAKIIDKARELSLFTTAGVPIVPMETNNLTISRIKTDPEFKFKKEGEQGQDVDFELDSVKLESKTVYGYAYVSLEAINSSSNLDSILNQVFSQSMANAIDNAFLYGQQTEEGVFDTFAPGGIMNDSNINVVQVSGSGSYDDFVRAIGKVKKQNGKPSVYGINSDTEEILELLKTNEGQYLEPPKIIKDMTKIVSNQLNSSNNGNDSIVFDPNALLIGIQNNIRIKIIEDTECLKKGLVGFQIYSMLDCKTILPKHICKISGIKAAIQ